MGMAVPMRAGPTAAIPMQTFVTPVFPPYNTFSFPAFPIVNQPPSTL